MAFVSNTRILIIGFGFLGSAVATAAARRGLHTRILTRSTPTSPAAADIAIGDAGVSYADEDGATHVLPADHIIVAKGAQGDLTLANDLEAAGFSVHTVGDCNGVGYIEGAIAAAADVAVAI